MTPFRRVPVNPINIMLKREALLAQPADFFAPFFGGRTPSLQEIVQFIEVALQRMVSLNVWENDIYTVEINHHAPFVHLDISRHDGAPCNCWRELQQIKNELVGPNCEAVELFPAESRKVDTSNQYHLWVHPDPEYRFPLGFAHRFVLENSVRMDAWKETTPYVPSTAVHGQAVA